MAASPRAGDPGPRTRSLPDVPRRADGRVDLSTIARGLAPLLGRPAPLLESAPGSPATGRWSYVVASVAGRITLEQGRLDWSGPSPAPGGSDPFTALDVLCERLGLTPDAEPDDGLPPFSGGFCGAFAYDLARHVERLPEVAAADRHGPWMDLVLADAVIAVDHETEAALLVERDLGGSGPPADLPELVGSLVPTAPPAPRRPGTVAGTSLPRDRYLRTVEAVLEHIAAGDTFQVNVTQRLTAPWDGDAHDLYDRLRTASAAPFGAVVWAGRGGLASVSPETFLQAEGRHVRTRPIKGTRPRAGRPEDDDANRRALATSAKDRAENVMVVDMERNDLGRVCVPGSVAVPGLLEVEGHPTVWHLVSTVEGDLRPDVGWGGLLRAAFPCGSVTGTPKVRAMQLIERYEPVRRGWYCGAIGFLSAGAMSTSVAIRTAAVARGRADHGVGGGIVADSDPGAEWQESLDKAVAFLRAVGARPPA